MSGKKFLVVGGLSVDEIHLLNAAPGHGQVSVANARHSELGGRGGNVAIGVFRASHTRPAEGETLPTQDENLTSVRLIAGVADDSHLAQFTERLTQSGVLCDQLEILPRLEGDDADPALEGKPVEQDFLTAFVDGRTGQTMQSVGFDTSNQWPQDRFVDIDSICRSEKPDLVILTMEPKRKIVQQIITTVHGAGIEILLFATPGEALDMDIYPKITHLVCSESNAARMLGYPPRDVNMHTWPQICERFTRYGVQNVAIRLGLWGAYYKNSETEGFVSGYRKAADLVDQTGTTTAFTCAYAAECVKEKDQWDIRSAAERGNKACALFSIEVGSDALPWSSDIDAFEVDPLYDSIEHLKTAPRPRKFGYKKFMAAQEQDS